MTTDPLDGLMGADPGPGTRYEPCRGCGGIITADPDGDEWHHRSGGCDNPAPADNGWWVL